MSLPIGSSFLAGAAAMRPLAIAEVEAVAVVTCRVHPATSRVLPTEGPIHASIENTDDEMVASPNPPLR